MSHLIAFEAKDIQRWIFAGGRLLDLVGGSDIVESLAPEVLHKVLATCDVAPEEDGVLLLAAAGRFRLVIHDDAKAHQFLRLWPLVIGELAPGLPFALTSLDFAGPLPLEAIQRQLAGYADHGRSLLPAVPLTLRAQRTGQAAIGIDPMRGEAIDAATALRRGQTQKRGHALATRFGLSEEAAFVSDIETDIQAIATAGGGNAVAMLHADGNGIGKVALQLAKQAHQDNGAAYRCFSDLLQAATQAAAAAALQEVFPPGLRCFPLRPIVLGGDDLTIVLPAAAGLPFADAFLTRFEAETRRLIADNRPHLPSDFPTHFTATAGIALVHSHYPFEQAHMLAESLCRWAKRQAHATQPSAIAFFRVSSSLQSDFQDILHSELTENGRQMTLAPYVTGRGDHPGLALLEPLQALRTAAAALPSGTWRKLVTAAHEQAGRSGDHLRRALEVAADGNPEAVAAVRQALTALRCGDDGFTAEGRSPILDVQSLLALGPWDSSKLKDAPCVS